MGFLVRAPEPARRGPEPGAIVRSSRIALATAPLVDFFVAGASPG